MRGTKVDGDTVHSNGNIADFLKKFLPHEQHDMCCNTII